VEVDPEAIRGRAHEGMYVLGLVDELRDIVKENSIEVVIMIGSGVPYSRILGMGSSFGALAPEFKLVPELRDDPDGTFDIMDIHPGGMFGSTRR